ncbi:hypothetical protein GWK41_08615 [Persephonella atlantica]|uniref:Transposase n=1 Tax=Persephonella atlantica TaxID=2699429 RepID=A0ABS1GJS7_9AQUI|nr:hypothetical protein [Persephonella atlantica]MBK3333131.1 hypothetical protein [Persephonella atlantica]
MRKILKVKKETDSNSKRVLRENSQKMKTQIFTANFKYDKELGLIFEREELGEVL